MREVIEELERKANSLDYSRDDCDHISASSYREAIALIKEGVK
jgi:hypothetical protein